MSFPQQQFEFVKFLSEVHLLTFCFTGWKTLQLNILNGSTWIVQLQDTFVNQQKSVFFDKNLKN